MNKSGNRFWSAVSKLWLDLAERLPKAQNGLISELQLIRHSQRMRALGVQAKYAAPPNVEVDLVMVRMFEIFLAEDVSQLIVQISRLFPRYVTAQFRSELIDKSTILAGGASWSLGIILGHGTVTMPYSREIVNDPKLPPEVQYIEVSLHQILPTLFAVVFDVRVDQSASDSLRQLQAARYLPGVTFNSLIPSIRAGYSIENARGLSAQATARWNEQFRASIETRLRSLLKHGRFSEDSGRRSPRLPAFQVYWLRGQLPESGELPKWFEATLDWQESLGMTFSPVTTYRKEGLVVAPLLGDWFDRINADSHRLIALGDYYKIMDSKLSLNENRTVFGHFVKEDLDEMFAPFAITHLLERLERDLRELRRTAFRGRRQQFLPFLYPGDVSLNENALSIAMMVERYVDEYSEMKGYYEVGMYRLRDVERQRADGSEPVSLSKDMHLRIDGEVALLQRSSRIVKDWISQYVGLKNMSATYALTYLVGLVTIVGVAMTFPIGSTMTAISEFVVKLSEFFGIR